jgi:membrane associated rhomboid family serine protease
VTALTLHADAQHVIGNIISGSIFGAAASRRLGAGGALLAIVVAGAAGNAANALYHLSEGHRSIGASTAVFAAVGLLAGVQTMRGYWRKQFSMIDFLAPAIGGLALLGTLGSSPDSDIAAHGFGFAAGAVVGLAVSWWLNQFGRPPSATAQWISGAAASLIIVGSWWLAIGL